MKALNILKESIERIPIIKYAFGIIGIAAAVTAIKGFGIENYNLPVVSILIIFGFMVLLLIFSSVLKSKDSKLKFAGYILTYTTLTITCVSSVLLFTSAFFEVPKELAEILNTGSSISADSTTCDTYKVITLTGKIIIDGKIQKKGSVGILQNSEIKDNLSSTGTFNLNFSSPEYQNNGLITLTLNQSEYLYELMEINLNDLQSKNNIMDLGTLSFPSIKDTAEKDSADFREESKVNNKDNIVKVKVNKKPRRITRNQKSIEPHVLPIKPIPKKEINNPGGPGKKIGKPVNAKLKQ